MNQINRAYRIAMVAAYRFDKRCAKIPTSCFIFFFLAMFFVSGCAGGGGSGSAAPAGTSTPATVVGAPSGTPDDPQTPAAPTGEVSPAAPGVAVTPSATPAPTANVVVTPTPTLNVVTTPSPTPAPTPAFVAGSLSCYASSLNAYCTNGNLVQDTQQLDLSAIFTGGNPQEHINNVSVQDDVLANTNSVCTNPNAPGQTCFHHSVCVTVIISVTGYTTLFTETSCGNIFNQGNKTLGRQ